MGIARNRAIDLLRSRPHQARLREGKPGSDVTRTEIPSRPDVGETVTLRRAVASALEGLPAAQRQTIELAYYAGLTQAEIAHELGEPLGTVKSRTREAMERLRVALGRLIAPGQEE